jgi:hypothetical protein
VDDINNNMNSEEPTAAEMRRRAGRARRLKNSDVRIAAAVAQLNSSERGCRVLASWKALVRADAAGLDSANWQALLTLARETADGRRDYLDGISPVAYLRS